jgi:hypothetical protein
MSFIDILGFSLSVLGIYSLVLYLRYLLPRYNIPPLSAFLNETQQLLGHAEEICAIQPESEYRAHLHLYDNHVFMFADCPRLLTPIQFSKPICRNAHREQSCPGDLQATAHCSSARPDMQTSYPLSSNRCYQVETRGSSSRSSWLSYHTADIGILAGG